MKMISKNRGFTIVELGISAIATLILLSVVYNLFRENLYPGISVEAGLDTQKDARMIMAYLTKDIRSAHQLTIKDGKISINCFTGKPKIGYPNGGLEAAQVEKIEYYRDKNNLIRYNKTTNFKMTVGKNVTDFRPSMSKDGKVVGIIVEAEVEVMIERQVFDKVKTVVYTKVYPRFLSEKAKYKGYFCSVDEDGTY